ncbi:MAG: hypothetical protein AABY54_07520 [Deltaproteobacteria bacterium]
MKNFFRSNKVISLISAFFLAVAPVNVGWAAPIVYAAESETEQEKESGLPAADVDKTKHEDMNKDKEHEGMHGMMMHDMKGWEILIGVAMIVMMAAHLVVLF